MKINRRHSISFISFRQEMERWRNRVALVTGASAGIGAAVCRVLAEGGMKVVGCARRLEKIEELAKERPGIIPYKVYNVIVTHSTKCCEL